MLPGNSFKLFKVLGIQIEVNVTWFIIFGLVSWGLSTVLFPAQLPGLSGSTYLVMGVVTALLFFTSILLHELSHSIVALRNDIPIKAITLFIFGGVAQMTKEPQTPGVEFRMAFAGPLASIGLGLMFGAIAVFGFTINAPLIIGPASYLALINIVLAIFNLVPGFPLDGGRIFRATLWYFNHDLVKSTITAGRAGQLVAFLLAALGIVWFLTGNLVNGIWFLLIAWFLETAAVSGMQSAKFQAELTDVAVKDVMISAPETVEGNITVGELVDDHFGHLAHGRFPVISGANVVGVVTLEDLRKAPRTHWGETLVSSIMTPLHDDMRTSADQTAFDAMGQMADKDLGQLLVIEPNGPLGLVTRGDILRFAKVREALSH